MYDETQRKILDATMNLIMEKGYTATTTKDIAKRASVNECTIFRKFKGKREIVVEAMNMSQWNPCLKEEDFFYCGDLEKDLCLFAKKYLEKVTPQMVKVSLGLRSPELYEVTKAGIKEIPDTFMRVLINYFSYMRKQGKINTDDIENLSVEFLAMNFGFVFFKASFGDSLTKLHKEEYIKKSVKHFVNGLV